MSDRIGEFVSSLFLLVQLFINNYNGMGTVKKTEIVNPHVIYVCVCVYVKFVFVQTLCTLMLFSN